MPTFDATPDWPEAFGFKIFWFAVQADSAASVLDALELGPGTPANWHSGVAAAYDSKLGEDAWIFLSPPVDGWCWWSATGCPTRW